MTDPASTPSPDDSTAPGHADHDHRPDPATSGALSADSLDADCQQAVAELYGFLDGFLTDEKRSGIQRHLDDCSPCLEAFEFEVELRTVVAQRCKEEVPESLKLKIAELLDGAEPGEVDALAD